ncbi:MAG: glutaredoxin 3 [Sphingomicrobium sp.]
MPKVEVFVKTTCPYCIRARRLLDLKGIDYKLRVVDFGGPDRAEMIERAGGRSTVPQIFIGQRYVGGCDDLMRLEDDGKLDDLLAAA